MRVVRLIGRRGYFPPQSGLCSECRTIEENEDDLLIVYICGGAFKLCEICAKELLGKLRLAFLEDDMDEYFDSIKPNSKKVYRRKQ